MVPSTMANKNYFSRIPFQWVGGTTNWTTIQHLDSSTSSPRGPDGQLALRANPHTWDRRTSGLPSGWGFSPSGPWVIPDYMGDAARDRYSDITGRSVMISATNEAIARFTGKVRKHNANLGVTLGSWKQSQNMIIDRSRAIASIFDRRIRTVRTMSQQQRRRIRAQDTASAYLEGVFGWVPLVDDIKAALGTLCRNPPDTQWVKSAVILTDKVNRIQTDNSTWQVLTEEDLVYRCTVSGRVTIVNQNLFLLNRLGLLNLPGVAWDLVPWSFVVNMFTNLGQMVNSLTDFVGVQIDNSSTTRSVNATLRISSRPYPGSGYTGNWRVLQKYTYRVRGAGVPTPTFQWRVPNLDLGLVAIAAALPLQRINKLNAMIGARF